MARPGILIDRKFLRLCHILGLPPAHVLGHLEHMWHICYDRIDDLLGDRMDAEIAAGWTGERGDFAAALIDARFVDELLDGRLLVHDLWENAPRYVLQRWERKQERLRKGKTLREIRAEVGRKGGLSSSKRRKQTSKQAAPDAHQMVSKQTPSGRLSPPLPQKAEEGVVGTNSLRSEPSGEGSERRPDDPVVLEFPLRSASGETWPLYRSKLLEYAESYEVSPEEALARLRHFRQWLVDHPTKRKTARGMPRALNHSMELAVQRGLFGRSNGAAPQLPRRTLEDLRSEGQRRIKAATDAGRLDPERAAELAQRLNRAATAVSVEQELARLA
jgi:hypothetical protein